MEICLKIWIICVLLQISMLKLSYKQVRLWIFLRSSVKWTILIPITHQLCRWAKVTRCFYSKNGVLRDLLYLQRAAHTSVRYISVSDKTMDLCSSQKVDCFLPVFISLMYGKTMLVIFRLSFEEQASGLIPLLGKSVCAKRMLSHQVAGSIKIYLPSYLVVRQWAFEINTKRQAGSKQFLGETVIYMWLNNSY